MNEIHFTVLRQDRVSQMLFVVSTLDEAACFPLVDRERLALSGRKPVTS